MTEFHPTIDPSEANSGETCDARVRRLVLTPELIEKMTTPLDNTAELPADKPKASSALEIYDMDKRQKEHTFIGRISP